MILVLKVKEHQPIIIAIIIEQHLVKDLLIILIINPKSVFKLKFLDLITKEPFVFLNIIALRFLEFIAKLISILIIIVAIKSFL